MFDVISLELFEGDVTKNELSFEKNQLISVDETVDDVYYLGHYTIPGTDETRTGKFPISTVEVLKSSIDESLESPLVPEMSIRDRIASMLKQQEEELLQKQNEKPSEPINEVGEAQVDEKDISSEDNIDLSEKATEEKSDDEDSEAAKKQSLIERMARLSGAGRKGGNGFNPFGIPVALPTKKPAHESTETFKEENDSEIEDLSNKKQFNIMTGEWMDVGTFKNSLGKSKTNEEIISDQENLVANESVSDEEANSKNHEDSQKPDHVVSDSVPATDNNTVDVEDSDLIEKKKLSHVEPEIHPKTKIDVVDKPHVPVTTSAPPPIPVSAPKPAQVYTPPEVPQTADILKVPAIKPTPPPVPTAAKSAPPPIPTQNVPQHISPIPKTTSPPPIPNKQPISPNVQTFVVSENPVESDTKVSPPPVPSVPAMKNMPPPIPTKTTPPPVPVSSTSPPPPIPSKPPQSFESKETKFEETMMQQNNTISANNESFGLKKQSILMNDCIADLSTSSQEFKSKDLYYFKDSDDTPELESTLKKTYSNACLLSFAGHEQWLLKEPRVPESAIVTIDGKLQKYFAQKEVHKITLSCIGESLTVIAIRILLEDYSYLDTKVIYDEDKSKIKFVEQVFTLTHTKEKDFLTKLASMTSNLEKIAMKSVGNKTKFTDSVGWVNELLGKHGFVQVLANRTFGINILKFDPSKGKLSVETKIGLGDVLVIKDGDYLNGQLESLIICNVDEEDYSFKCITVDSNGEVIIVGRNFDNMTKGKVRVFRPLSKSFIQTI